MVNTARITLTAGTSKKATFTTSRDTAGNYTADINGKTGIFVVKEAVVPSEVPPEVPSEVPSEVPPVIPPTIPKPINWPLIGGIIGGAIAVGLVIFFLVRRRRAF
ncbi:hypothetical protein ES703_87592 [subsurface metagenome]